MELDGYNQSEALVEQPNSPNRAYLTAMAEAVTQDHPDFTALAGDSPHQKKNLKRVAPDSTSPESRRAKRQAPAAAMSNNPEDSAYVESAVEAAQAAAAATARANSVDDAATYNALQQATVDDHASVDAANASSTAAAALGTMYPTIHVPQSTEATFAAQAAANETGQSHSDAGFSAGDIIPADGLPQQTGGIVQTPSPQNGIRSGQPSFATNSGLKPAVGSEEWHKQRKDNHKEVERRRRETINEGINELAKIVPGCEKNKGSILQRTVSFIRQLKENEAQNIEKWTLEKLLTEQAIHELSKSNDKLKEECARVFDEMKQWKQLAENAGLSLDLSKEEPSS